MNESNIYTILFVDDAPPKMGIMAVKILTNEKLTLDLLELLKTNSKIINPVLNTEITKINVLWAKNCYDAIPKYINNKDKINLILMDFDLSEYNINDIQRPIEFDLSLNNITDIQRANLVSELLTINENKGFCKNPDTMDKVDADSRMKDGNNGCNTARRIRELGYKGPIIPVSLNNTYFDLFKKPICGNWFVENEQDIPEYKVTIKFLPFLIKQLTKYYKIDETIPYLESINIDDKTPMLDLSGNPQSSVTKSKSFLGFSNKVVPIDIQQLQQLQETPGVNLAYEIAQKNPSVKLASKIGVPVINTQQLQENPTVKSVSNIYKLFQKKPTGGKKTKKLHKKLHKKQRKTKKRILGRRRKTNRIK